jgi:hypothetical protein
MRPRTVVVALCLLLPGLVLASRLLGAADEGPRIDRVGVETVARPFVPEDPPGPELHLTRKLTIEGRGFVGTSQGPWVAVELDDGHRLEAPLVIQRDEHHLEAWLPEGARGGGRLIVTGSDHGRASRRVEL